MTTVLITAIAGDIAQAIATIIREEFPRWRVIGCDMHTRHGGTLVTDALFLAPAASAPNYDAWIAELVQEQQVDICIPMSEAELAHFAAGGHTHVGRAKLLMPNARAIEVGADKLTTARHLVATGCPAPWTVPADDPGAAVQFPCIFKPRRSAGSKGVIVCGNAEDARYLISRYPPAVFQELLLPEDQEVTCAIYRTRDGRIAIAQLLRRLTGGFTGWAEIIDDTEIRRQCEQLAISLDLWGPINAQLRRTPAGPRIFEINARFSSTVLMRHRLGYQDVVWAVRETMGERVELTTPAPGAVVVRTQGAAVLPTVAQSRA